MKRCFVVALAYFGLPSLAEASSCNWRVIKIVAAEYGRREAQVSNQTKIAADGPNTIEDVEIKLMVEERFKLKISDVDWAKLKFVGDIDNYLRSHVPFCR